MIFTSTIVTVTNSFCPPNVVSCSLNDLINNFILAGESCTQINDVGTGCALNAYDNRTQQSITLCENKTYTALVSSLYSTSERVAIWIDFNNNFVFEPSEMVASRMLNGTLNTPVTITIPSAGSGGFLGVHRMRVSLAYLYVPDPCSLSPIVYGETHDYTVNIIGYIGKIFSFAKLGIAQNEFL